MAYQVGDVKLKGRIGDLTFYKQGESFLAKRKGGVSSRRMATDPKFERSRENSTEFGLASAEAKRIRQAIREVLPLFPDGTMQTRLNKRLLQLIKGDANNPRGKRRLTPENLPLLIGFSFNSKSAWKDVYYAPVERRLDHDTGKLSVLLPEHWVSATLALPKEASGVRFTVSAVEVTDGKEWFPGSYEHSPIIPASGLIPEQLFELTTDTRSQAVILMVGIAFFKEVGGYPVPIEQPMVNALDVIDVFLPST